MESVAPGRAMMISRLINFITLSKSSSAEPMNELSNSGSKVQHEVIEYQVRALTTPSQSTAREVYVVTLTTEANDSCATPSGPSHRKDAGLTNTRYLVSSLLFTVARFPFMQNNHADNDFFLQSSHSARDFVVTR